MQHPLSMSKNFWNRSAQDFKKTIIGWECFLTVLAGFDPFYFRFHVLLVISTSMGKISSLPASISMISTSLDRGLKPL